MNENYYFISYIETINIIVKYDMVNMQIRLKSGTMSG